MNRLFLVIAAFPMLCGAQPLPDTSGLALYKQAYNYLKGANAAYEPDKAVSLFAMSAAKGNGQAMNALGDIYVSGNVVRSDVSAAIAWYKRAYAAGYYKALSSLGKLYREGTLVPQDFELAASYYHQGAEHGDHSCKNWLAYSYYKGFGVEQDYTKAYALYQELADSGDANAMYFLGKCYRNGYGINPDVILAREWLIKAAARGQNQAIHELRVEPQPDNRYINNPGLQSEVQKMQAHSDNLTTADCNDLGGMYHGYAIYYDFSHRYVVEISPLTLSIDKSTDGSYIGKWKENDSLECPVKASYGANMLAFDSSCRYTRQNHYSNRNPEPYRFDNTSLALKFKGDSMYLTGEMHFYSINRREPSEPVSVFLSKSINAGIATTRASIIVTPNPAVSQVRATITTTATRRITLEIVDNSGKLLIQTGIQQLPAGTYTYSFDLEDFAAGSYFLKLGGENKIQTKQFIKL